MIISSVDNKNIKYIKKLKNNKYMENERKFIVEGEHLVNEALKEKLLTMVIKLDKNTNHYGVSELVVTDNVMRSISSMPSIPLVIGICDFIKEKETLGDKIIILDGVQDPGNLGTIIRSAKAFNFDTVVLSNSCVKKYNEKVIRATQGMLFKVNVITKDLLKFIPFIKEKGYEVYGTNVIRGTSVKKLDVTGKIAVVMGSEGAGVSLSVSNILDKNLYINMNDDCESLNVAVAASIIMHELGDK